MGKWWSLLFAGVMLFCLGTFIIAPSHGWWLPEGVSTHAADVDFLFYIILYITGFFFILTETILVVFMFQYAGRPDKHGHIFGAHPFQEKVYWTTYFKRWFRPVSRLLHNQHRVEIAWTIVPAVILLYLAFAQVPTWLRIKDRSRTPTFGGEKVPIQVEVSARQFEWRVRYPSSARLESWLKNADEKDFKDFGAFQHGRAKFPHQDDVHVPGGNEVHLWKGQTILVHLGTLDVIHSFNIPFMRVKQDALPGKTIPVWFTPIKANTKKNPKTGRWEDAFNPETQQHGDKHYRWEIACAELCGWGHHRMIGRVYVHETKQDFFAWLKKTEEEQTITKR